MNLRIFYSIAAAFLLLLTCSSLASADEAATAKGTWEPISTAVTDELTKAGKKFGFSGLTAGVTVDRTNGDVYMVANGLGIYKSTDQGKTFARVDGGLVGGRCETGFALNVDPAGNRLACFMLDGKCAWTGDGGKTWKPMADVGRNWDYAAVDWSTPEVKNIFAGLHESGGQVMYSNNGGKSWTKLLHDREFDRTGGLGIFDENTLVYTQKGKGIQRSTDAGKTWTKVADLEPVGCVVHVHKGTAYWLSRQGLLVSKDRGLTWTVQGKPVDATIGPMIDPKNEKRIVVAGLKGIFRTSDGGETWTAVTALPKNFKVPRAGSYSNIAWDPVNDIIYASHMGQPTYRWRE